MSSQPLPLALGAIIRHARRARGIRLEELAHSTGLSISYLSLIENAKRPLTEAVASAIADALGTHR